MNNICVHVGGGGGGDKKRLCVCVRVHVTFIVIIIPLLAISAHFRDTVSLKLLHYCSYATGAQARGYRNQSFLVE